jgi:hypothetical protein
MHMRNKEEGFNIEITIPKPCNENPHSSCDSLCNSKTTYRLGNGFLNTKIPDDLRIKCRDMCYQKNESFCKNLGLKPLTADYFFCNSACKKLPSFDFNIKECFNKCKTLNKTSYKQCIKNCYNSPGNNPDTKLAYAKAERNAFTDNYFNNITASYVPR